MHANHETHLNVSSAGWQNPKTTANNSIIIIGKEEEEQQLWICSLCHKYPAE
jgi:frataxin-like iron-binding protein CyaY